MFKMLPVDSERRFALARIAKKAALVVLIIILTEALYLDVDGTSWRARDSMCFSFGFPFRSVDYRPPTGEMGPISENEWAPGLKVYPILLVIDIFVVLFLGLMLARCVPTVTLASVVKGCVLGSVTGGAFSCLAELSPESWVSWAVVVVVIFGLIPIAIYAFSIGHKWQKTTIIVISAVTVFTFWRSLFLVEGLFDDLMEDGASLNLPMVLRLLALMTVPVCECFVIMLAHRKVFPASWQKRRPNYLRTGTEQKAVADSASHLDRAWGGRLSWRAVVYLVMLAVSLYVGFHFWTLREIRNDPFYALDAIWSELERQGISLDGWHTQNWPDSDEIGWNASFGIEIGTNEADRYHARVSKHILIPWIEVTIEQTETVGQGEENQGSDRK